MGGWPERRRFHCGLEPDAEKESGEKRNKEKVHRSIFLRLLSATIFCTNNPSKCHFSPLQQ
jgi:hypothetical protein